MTSFFPTCIRYQSADIWFGWISPEAGSDYFFAIESRVVWALDEARLVKCLQEELSLRRESETTFLNVDALMRGLDMGSVISADLALNIWNLFTDLKTTADGTSAGLFCKDLPGSLDFYDRLFSLSSGGEVLAVEKQALRKADTKLLRMIVEEGSRLLSEMVSLGVQVKATESAVAPAGSPRSHARIGS